MVRGPAVACADGKINLAENPNEMVSLGVGGVNRTYVCGRFAGVQRRGRSEPDNPADSGQAASSSQETPQGREKTRAA